MRKFLKNWGALSVAIVALVGSLYALYLDNKHLELQQTQHEEALEADEQHAEFTKLSFHFENLRDRLNDQREWLKEIPDDAKAAGRPFHDEATENWREADKELLAGNFDRVRELIEVAMVSLEKCYSAAEEEAGKLPLLRKPVWIGEEEATY